MAAAAGRGPGALDEARHVDPRRLERPAGCAWAWESERKRREKRGKFTTEARRLTEIAQRGASMVGSSVMR
jgi:hypothetical protein